MSLESRLLSYTLAAEVAALLICASATPVPGAEPFGTGAEAKPAAKPEGPSVNERNAYDQIEAAFASSQFDKAILLAKDFVRSAESETLKTEAALMVAESQRKKKEWNLAQGAYLSLLNRYEKGSKEYARTGAIAEVLRASPDGVYHPLAQSGDGSAGKTLDDDDVLTEALACLADNRAKRLELRLPRIKRARTAQETVQLFLPMAEEIRDLRGISPKISPSLERAAVQMAAMRLAPLSESNLAALRQKDLYYSEMLQKRGLNSNRQAEMLQCKAMCESLAATEDAFLSTMDQLEGTRDWPEGQSLRQKSQQRRDAFTKLAESLTPPEREERSRGGNSDRGRRGNEGNRW